MRSARVVILALAVAAALAPAARADGLPVLGLDVGGEGVAAGTTHRYVTVTLPNRTLLARVEQDGGRIARSRLLRGRFTVPAVAYDGSTAGLSADARTLVLVRPRATFPQARTTFAIVDPRRMRARLELTLRGDFSFDAISPDGRWLYLVQYLSADDPSKYLVRLYDLRRGRLLPEPVIDPREVGDVMRGSPITRASSPDGRWAYTLYDGGGTHPFIHALDTVARTARCIDLHDLMRHPRLWDLQLLVEKEGATLTVTDHGDPLVHVDTETFELFEPEAEPEPASATVPGSEDGFRWELLAFSGPGALLTAGLVAVFRRRRHG